MLTVLQERMVKRTLVKISLVFLSMASIAMAVEVRSLHYNFNQNVTIWISNQPCAFKKYKNAFPWAAKAVRKDGEIMEGCFNGEDETVTIQWKDGDRSKFPANYFLQSKDINI